MDWLTEIAQQAVGLVELLQGWLDTRQYTVSIVGTSLLQQCLRVLLLVTVSRLQVCACLLQLLLCKDVNMPSPGPAARRYYFGRLDRWWFCRTGFGLILLDISKVRFGLFGSIKGRIRGRRDE
ncbi:hypothetical protein RALBFv3_23520 (plasmid) [Ralstonia solanacearum]|nr:hypothetical protein RALBFv3_15915 [Ralstonia solanacearum]AMP77070.1 hypothetical protein RALBFv3_23520 [Ralstonia solanacearum]OAI68463.1 hypothetical protein RSP797_19340 [Ralstonia solanacearum]